jgi:hypothetical protein
LNTLIKQELKASELPNLATTPKQTRLKSIAKSLAEHLPQHSYTVLKLTSKAVSVVTQFMIGDAARPAPAEVSVPQDVLVLSPSGPYVGQGLRARTTSSKSQWQIITAGIS